MKNGDRIGRYRVAGKIGGGGVGTVYKAIDTRLDRTVALKFLRDSWSNCCDMRVRFAREAELAAAIQHPHICNVHGLEEVDGRMLIVMEMLWGRPLSECINGRALAVDEVLRIGRQLADALGEIHDRGLVHRDVKPANVFIDREGNAKLIDFGLARERCAEQEPVGAEQLTDPGTGLGVGALAGTVGYMSPEQTRGGATDFGTDVFSLGVVLYEAVTGVRPFDAKDASGVFDLVFSFDPPPPSCVNPQVPAALNLVIRRALSKSPSARQSSARELLRELDLIDDAVVARPRSETRLVDHDAAMRHTA